MCNLVCQIVYTAVKSKSARVCNGNTDTRMQIPVLRAAVAVLLITHNCRDAAAKNKGHRHSARHNAGRWTAEPKAPREAPAVAESGGSSWSRPGRAAAPGPSLPGLGGSLVGGARADEALFQAGLLHFQAKVSSNRATWPSLLTGNPYYIPELGPQFRPILSILVPRSGSRTRLVASRKRWWPAATAASGEPGRARTARSGRARHPP